jgi:hypothetical protein
MSSSSGSGRMEKGAVNVAETEPAACKSRTALTAREDASASEAGYRRCHGESVRAVARTKKRMFETSVRIPDSSATARKQSEPGCVDLATGCSRKGSAVLQSRSERQSELPGAESATYRTKGPSFEHENPDSSAGNANPGKLSGPVMSRAGGGVSVVVRARESRAHGEGRQ